MMPLAIKRFITSIGLDHQQYLGDTIEEIAREKAGILKKGCLGIIGANAPEVRDRDRLSRIPHPTAGFVPNIETPLNMSRTPTIDPVAAPLLGQHTKDVLRRTLGYDDRRIAELAEAGAFGKATSDTRGTDE